MTALKALKFRVYNYRNIDDSEWIDLANVTALVGRNESGKTALLKALHKFNPATAQPYKPQREFPRDRFTHDFKNAADWPVCAVKFKIDASLHPEFKKLIGDAEPPKTVTCTRHYDGKLYYELNPPPVEANLTYEPVVAALEKFKAAAMRTAAPAPDQEVAYQAIRTDLLNWTTKWTTKFSGDRSLRSESGRPLLEALRTDSNTKAKPEVADILTALQSELSKLAKLAAAPAIAQQIADVLKEHLPVFIYFDNYGILDSAIYLSRFLEDQAREPESPKVRTVEAMFKHVNLTAKEIAELGQTATVKAKTAGQEITAEMITQDQEQVELRRIKLNSASSDITNRFSEWWRQR